MIILIFILVWVDNFINLEVNFLLIYLFLIIGIVLLVKGWIIYWFFKCLYCLLLGLKIIVILLSKVFNLIVVIVIKLLLFLILYLM